MGSVSIIFAYLKTSNQLTTTVLSRVLVRTISILINLADWFYFHPDFRTFANPLKGSS
jgi:hypothetical protein